MSAEAATDAAPAGRPPAQSALDWLRPLGLTGSIAATVAAMLVSFLVFGLFLPYWRVADQDIYLAYEGLLAAGGLPQEYFDHTGYLSYLTLGWWFEALHAVGLLPIHTIAELPPVSDTAAYNAAWTALVRAGRVLSFLFAAGFVTTATLLIRRLVGDWRIAAVAGFVLAFSGGVAMHSRYIRTELLSGGLLALGVLVLLVAVRAAANPRRPLCAGIAAFLVALAIVAKVQAIVVALALPILAIAWLRSRTEAVPPKPVAWWLAGSLVVAAIVAAVPAVALLAGAAADTGGALFRYTPVIPAAPGLYQVVLGGWFLLGIAAFAVAGRVGAAEALAAAAAIILGVALAVLTLAIRYHPQNALALLHPVEHMFQFASFSHPDLAGGEDVFSGSLTQRLLHGIGETLAVRSFVLEPSFRPTLIVEWLLIPATVWLWRRGKRRMAAAVGVTLLVVWGADAIFTLRSLKIEYYIYTDPLVIAAAALAASALPAPGRRAGLVGMGLLFVMVVVSQLEPEKLAFDQVNPDWTCPFYRTYTARLPPFPFCAPPADAVH